MWEYFLNKLNLKETGQRLILNEELKEKFDPFIVQDVKKSTLLYCAAFIIYVSVYGIYHYQIFVFFGLLMIVALWPLLAMNIQSITMRNITYRIVLSVMVFYGAAYTGGIHSPFLILAFFLTMTVMPHSALLLSRTEKLFGLLCMFGIVGACLLHEYYAFLPDQLINFYEEPIGVAVILISGISKVAMVDKYHKKAIYSYHQNLSVQLEKHKKLVQNANLNVLAFDADTYEIKNFSPSSKIFTAYYSYNIDSFKDNIIALIEISRTVEGSYTDQLHLTMNGETHYFEVVTEYYSHKTSSKSLQSYSHEKSHDEVFCLIYDVTNRVNYEKSIIDARDRAVELYQSKSSFLAQMSHELRTPLNAIIGFSEVMNLEMLGAMPKSYKEYAKNINQSGNYLLTIVNDILDMAWIESGKYDPYISQMDFRDTLEHILAVTKHLAELKEIVINLHEEGDYIENFHSDVQAVKQILINIISNSVKYCDKKSVINVSITYEEEHITCHIQDNGHGFSDNVLKHFGTPFNIDKNHLVDGQKSTGLGLSITKGLTDVLGGEITVMNAPEGGAIVCITIPSRPDYENKRSKKYAA